jgi:hypothetical protein
MADNDEEDYVFYGTPIEDEEETRAGQRRKEIKDPALTKQLPLHKQVQAHCCERGHRHQPKGAHDTACLPLTGGHRCGGAAALPWRIYRRLQCRLLQQRGLRGGLGAVHIQVLPRQPLGGQVRTHTAWLTQPACMRACVVLLRQPPHTCIESASVQQMWRTFLSNCYNSSCRARDEVRGSAAKSAAEQRSV